MDEKPIVAAEECSALGISGQTIKSFPNSEIKLGDLTVARALPVRNRRLVGPWCFLDRFGPLTFADGKPMDVAPHPHIGLQTVTWLIDGEMSALLRRWVITRSRRSLRKALTAGGDMDASPPADGLRCGRELPTAR